MKEDDGRSKSNHLSLWTLTHNAFVVLISKCAGGSHQKALALRLFEICPWAAGQGKVEFGC